MSNQLVATLFIEAAFVTNKFSAFAFGLSNGFHEVFPRLYPDYDQNSANNIEVVVCSPTKVVLNFYQEYWRSRIMNVAKSFNKFFKLYLPGKKGYLTMKIVYPIHDCLFDDDEYDEREFTKSDTFNIDYDNPTPNLKNVLDAQNAIILQDKFPFNDFKDEDIHEEQHYEFNERYEQYFSRYIDYLFSHDYQNKYFI
jgi:hypothetical protein